MKLRNEILLQYYHEQVTIVVDRTKKLSNAELIVKLASSSADFIDIDISKYLAICY